MSNIMSTPPEYLHDEVRTMHVKKHRLVQIHCTQVTVGVHDGVEVSYTFEKDLELSHIRVNVPHDYVLDSISDIYSFAFIYENEMKDLFGVKFQNLSIDFGGSFYKTAVESPMLNEFKEPKEAE